MNAPYTISDALAGSISFLLEQQSRQDPHAKLLYMVYGYDQETYKRCWDTLHAHFYEAILLASIQQLPGTTAEVYPSGAHTMIHFRNVSSMPVVCFHNGEFEGYNTSFGKIERIGNHVTGNFAAALVRWLGRDSSMGRVPTPQGLASELRTPALSEMLQLLFDIVRPRLEHVVAYCNTLVQSKKLTLATWGELLPLLGLFRDPDAFQTPASFRRSLIDNYTLSQEGHWQQETNERIRNATIDTRAKAILLGVLANPSRLGKAKEELDLEDIRSLVARSRRSTEQIAQALIEEELRQLSLNRLRPLGNEEVHGLAVQVFESYKNQEQQTGVGSASGEMATLEYLQHVKSNLSRETTSAIQKALAQQSPIIDTNLFLGILRCLLAWKEEQEEEQKRLGQVHRAHPSCQQRIEKLTVQGVQLLPNPSPEKWTELARTIDQRIRDQWKELFADIKLALSSTMPNSDDTMPPIVNTPSRSSRKRAKRFSKRASNQGVPAQDGDGAEEVETGEDILLEQLNDLENSEPKLLEVSVQILGSASEGNRPAQSDASVTFSLEYDLVEGLLLQHLVGLDHTGARKSSQKPYSSPAVQQRKAVDRGDTAGEKRYQGMAWTCGSETAIGSDIRAVGFSLVRGEVDLHISMPLLRHLDTPGARELAESFIQLTEPMREKDEGVGYFSTSLLPSLPSFLTAYARLLLEARQTAQDPFDRLYGPWIASLFTLDLSRVEAMTLTHIVTPFHPLQLRWRQTYEQFLIRHIEQCSARPSTLTAAFIKELENLSQGNVPGVLISPQASQSPTASIAGEVLTQETVKGNEEDRVVSLSYPSVESRTGLFNGYKATLPRLQKLPDLLIRKMKQFLRIYPSAIDRIQVSVISPGDLAVEHSLSQMFEAVQREYNNAGFFTRIYIPDGAASTSLSPLSTRRRHYNEEQGELHARTRYQLFPRTEFVTLHQELLKTSVDQQFLPADSQRPTQHLFLLLDHLGVTVQTHEIPSDAKAILDSFAAAYSSSEEVTGAVDSPDLSILLHQGLETYNERTQLWTRGMVDPRDAFSLLYYVLAARSQGKPDSLYRYFCNLGRFQPGDFGSDTLIKTLHEHGIWVAIVDRAITREFFGTSLRQADSSLVLIDFHKGIGPQREYNLTISSTWTKRVLENVEIALDQIAEATQVDIRLLARPGLATAILRQFQNISGGLALQLAATDANTKGLLGLLVTAFEVSRGDSAWRFGERYRAGKRSYYTVIPLDDHPDWFERDEIRTDLLIVHFDLDEEQRSVHLYFSCIECKFDEDILHAEKGLRQLRETARRLQKRFAVNSPEYSFRLRDLVEAVRSLAAIYRDQLPDSILDLLWTNSPGVSLHLEESEFNFFLALYQIKDQLVDVKEMCEEYKYQLLVNVHAPFEQLRHEQGIRACIYRFEQGVGQTFDQFINWIVDDSE